MSNPITFPSASTRFGLPFLFAAQAQKEVFVNEALARLDALLHRSIEGEADTPPSTPANGEAWLIGNAPTGLWDGHAGELALRESDNWLFAAPQDGMVVFDKSADQFARFDGAWLRADAITPPTGGTTVDTEARDAINALSDALVAAGILPGS